MKSPIIYDLQVQYADVVFTVYLPSQKILNVFYNTFAVVDNRQLNFELKDEFPEIDKIMFWNYTRPVIGEKPFEQLRDVILSENAQVFSWNAESEKALKQADELCSPYNLRQVGLNRTQEFISVERLNEKAATVDRNRKRTYPTLETQSAYAGLSIPQTPNLTFRRNSKALNSQSVAELIFYSTNRTINTARLLQTPLYKSIVETKQDVIKSYHLNAKIDDTDSTISSLTLTKNQTIDFTDSPKIEFKLEVNGKKIDLLEHLYQEKIIPEAVYRFYKKLDGTTFKNYKMRLGKQTKLYVPYYDQELKPVNSYATFSLGGNHGSYAAQPLETAFDSEESKASPSNKVQQFFYAYSIDIENCYPSMNVKLKIFENEQTHDYADMLKENLRIKHSLPGHKSEWTKSDYQNARKRKKLKSILNTATGAADRNDRYGMLHLNNKTMSMRIMVNLIIYELGTFFVRNLNAKIISTNTDGIKIAFDNQTSLEEVQKIVNRFNKKYGLNFSVKKIDRILVKDTNNEIEWHRENNKDVIDTINGKLGKGYNGKIRLDGNLDHPIIVDMAVTEYLSAHRKTSYNDAKKWIKKYLQQKTQDDKNFNGMQWALFVKPTSSMNYVWDGQHLDTTWRFFFSKNGKKLQAFNRNGKATKIRSWASDKVDAINIKHEINKIQKEIDIIPYLQWALSVLKQWLLDDDELSLDLNSDLAFKKKPEKQIKTQKELKVKSENSILGKYLQKQKGTV